jgi:hypothetical protein
MSNAAAALLRAVPRPTQGAPTSRGPAMTPLKTLAIALLVAGVLGLAYGGFSYTKDSTAVKLGPLELSVKQKETVNIPVWAGIGAIVAGGLLLAFGSRRS